MRCQRVKRWLPLLAGEDLPPRKNRRIRSHVESCPPCGRELEEYYKKQDKESAGLYCSMKPGITGPWQVMMRTDMENYQDRVELDDWYVLNHSLWNDIKIIGQTILCVITGKGAY